MDGPGHYFRRIKTVAVSIPSIAGPYTSINCTLTLLKSSIRKNALLDSASGKYERQGSEDSCFSEYFGSLQTIVTSTAQNDSGMFETNLREERYLPFEGSGAISEWQLELPAGIRQFDYDTISDAILHLRYTAREGGGLLRSRALEHLTSAIGENKKMPLKQLFSLRHEFSTEWSRFLNPLSGQPQKLSIDLRNQFPYLTVGRQIGVSSTLSEKSPQGPLN